MLTIEQVRDGLRNHKMVKVAKEVGIDRTTLSAIMNDPHHEPRYATVKKLSDYLTANA